MQPKGSAPIPIFSFQILFMLNALIVQYTVCKPSLANLSYISSPLQVRRIHYPNNSTWPEHMMNVFVISIYTVHLFHKHEINTSRFQIMWSTTKPTSVLGMKSALFFLNLSHPRSLPAHSCH